MTEKYDSNALIDADSLLLRLIDKQPDLFAPKLLDAANGKAVGEFIAALRNRLAEMYQQSR